MPNDLTPLEDFELVLRRVREKHPHLDGSCLALLRYMSEEIEALHKERSKIHNAKRQGRRSKSNSSDTSSGKDGKRKDGPDMDPSGT